MYLYQQEAFCRICQHQRRIKCKDQATCKYLKFFRLAMLQTSRDVSNMGRDESAEYQRAIKDVAEALFPKQNLSSEYGEIFSDKEEQ